MRYRRIAVVGASGFVGRYVVKRLAKRGAVIAAISRHADMAKFLQPMGDVGQIGLLNADLGDEAALAVAIAGADSVVNLPGVLHERGSQTFDLVHHRGPGMLARLAKAQGVTHFVHVSAIGADAQSDSLYARSKAAGEAAVRAAFPEAVILRPSIIFGPEDKFFNRFARMAQTSAALPLIGGGHTRIQPVYVGDVADAIVRALNDEGAAGRTYELGGPRVYTFRELMEIMLAEIDRKRRFVDVPWNLAETGGRFFEWLPVPPLTRDQVRMLRRDNVVAPGAPGLAELGVTPTSVEVILPTYMDRYRRGGWFKSHRMASS